MRKEKGFPLILSGIVLTCIYIFSMCFFRYEFLVWKNLLLVGVLSAIACLAFASEGLILVNAAKKTLSVKGRIGVFLGGMLLFHAILWILLTAVNVEGKHNLAAVNAASAVLYLLFAAMLLATAVLSARREKNVENGASSGASRRSAVLRTVVTAVLSIVCVMYAVSSFLPAYLFTPLASLAAKSGSLSVLGYTEGTPIQATEHEYKFDRDRLLLGAYCTSPDDTASAKLGKEAGLDFFISYSVSDAFLDACAENGLGMIAGYYNLPRYYADHYDASTISQWYDFDGKTGYKDHPALWGDDLFDEPDSDEFPPLAPAIDNYYAKTDGKICLINMLPGYGDVDLNKRVNEYPSSLSRLFLTNTEFTDPGLNSYKAYISDYINTVDSDYICMDLYPYEYEKTDIPEMRSTSSKWLRTMDIIAEACRGTGRDFWMIVQAAGTNKELGMHYCEEPADMSQQAYASMCFGAKAVIYACFQTGWWDEASHMLTNDGRTTPTYDAVKTVNADLEKIAELYGEYEYKSTYMVNAKRVAGQNYGLFATTVDSEKADIKSENGLLVGTFAKPDGSRAFVVTNMEELGDKVTSSASFTLPGAKGLTVYRNGEPSTVIGNTAELTLEPGEGVFITVG